MAVGRIPTECPTVLLPKCAEPGAPEKFCRSRHQISWSGASTCFWHRRWRRTFHSVLGRKRLAFRQGDGRADSVWFIQGVIRQHQDDLRPLNTAFADVKKAFDSVSHVSILVAAARLGVPQTFLG